MNAGGSEDKKYLNNVKLDSSDPINIQYTSGTTGSRKPRNLEFRDLRLPFATRLYGKSNHWISCGSKLRKKS